ncbi:hypothetical protein D3C81_2001290 [compost metagenome]
MLKDDSAKAAYQDAARDHHASLVQRFPDLSQSQVARRAMREFPSFDDWLKARQDE